jgi:hypothetical protein
MPTCVNWDDAAHTIIRQQLIGKWTYEEYFSSGAETQRLTSSVPHTVHVIVDFSGSIAYDTKVLAAAQSFDRNFPPNQGCLVLIQCPAYIQAVFDIATRLYPRIGENAKYVASLEEAYRFIDEQVTQGMPDDTES